MYRNETDQGLGIMPAAVVCFQPPSGNSASAQAGNLKVTGILLLVSVVFLVLTLIVYTALPKLRDLQGLCYMNMCVSMAIGLLSLSILQFTPGYIGQNMCAFTAFKQKPVADPGGHEKCGLALSFTILIKLELVVNEPRKCNNPLARKLDPPLHKAVLKLVDHAKYN
ncbi:hypothetical protein EVAR_74731_1 [Eumeta japonica]|uniref:Uncharacterized protein n=1 Tax=Eumeta variegata TaxID=151549 RepID=A0A4C1SSA4_EUMVA|nr:hypothetical protein EVAR_74731_1 [Eumeta japonica]